ncbi:MAG: YihY/virulence factor BrkB family protein [Streptosporangiales bacterium]
MTNDPAKPNSPIEMTKPSWLYVGRKTARELVRDECTDLAAALTYYAVLAVFPALIALLSLLGVFGQGARSVNAVLGLASQVGAGSMADTLRPILVSLSQSPGAGIGLVLGILGALWSASGYVGAFGRAMNRIYGIREGRPIWKLRPIMILITLAAVVLAAITLLILIMTGPAAAAVGSVLGLGNTAVLAWQVVKWPVLLIIVIITVALLYYATPNVSQPKFRWMSIGAVVAIVTWLVASGLFGFYLANFSSYNKTYGSLAGAIVFLLWLWITNLALLFGAELDSELERGRQLQAGIPAEEAVQLPPRDTRGIDKADTKHADDVARGRRLRESRGRTSQREEPQPQRGGAEEKADQSAGRRAGADGS